MDIRFRNRTAMLEHLTQLKVPRKLKQALLTFAGVSERPTTAYLNIQRAVEKNPGDYELDLLLVEAVIEPSDYEAMMQVVLDIQTKTSIIKREFDGE